MKFDINNNPALMQAAGNTPKAQFVKLIFAGDNQQIDIGSNTEFTIRSISNGIPVERTYPATEGLNNTRIVTESDANTPIVIIGDLTRVVLYFGYAMELLYVNATTLQNLDRMDLAKLSENARVFITDKVKNIEYLWCDYINFISTEKYPNLESLYISSCKNLTGIDISKSNISSIVISGAHLNYIKARATTTYEYDSVLYNLLNSSGISATGLLVLQTGDPYNTQTAEAAIAKGWTVEYVDA